MSAILIVDDERTVRETLAFHLSKAGHQTRSAATFADAELALRHHRFDLILCDIILDEQSGMELLALARATPNPPSVVMISGEPSVETALQAVRQGAYDYLVKPITQEMLLHVCARALEDKRLRDSLHALELEILGQAMPEPNESPEQGVLALGRTFAALRQSEERFRRIFDHIQDVYFRIEPHSGRILSVSPSVRRQLGFDPQQLEGRDVTTLLGAGEGSELYRLLRDGLQVQDFDVRCLNASGEQRRCSVSAALIYNSRGQPEAIEGTLRDITRRKMAERLIRDQNRILQLLGRNGSAEPILDAGLAMLARWEEPHTALLIHDPQNPAQLRIVTLSSSLRPFQNQMSDFNAFSLLRLTDSADKAILCSAALNQQPPIWPLMGDLFNRFAISDLTCLTLGGSHLPPLGYLLLFSSRAECEKRLLRWRREQSTGELSPLRSVCDFLTLALERQRNLDEMWRLSFYDPVTGLPNRRLLQERLGAWIGEGSNRKLAVMIADIDYFRDINDSLGHAAGDLLLAMLARRLTELVPQPAVLARIGGDEFVLVSRLDADESPQSLFDRFFDKLAEPFMLQGRAVAVTASAGVALYPEDGGNAEELLQLADSALQTAKRERTPLHRYEAADSASVSRRLQVNESLQHALIHDEFYLVWQPRLDLADGKVRNLEVLVRWRNDDMEMPSQFLPHIEESGKSAAIDLWVLDHLCAQLRLWREGEFPDLTASLNLSAQLLHRPDLLDLVTQTLASYELPAEALVIEVTERMLMHNPETSIRQLAALHEFGIKIAVDDFGTGYSSLANLHRLPLNLLKIDQSFVRGIGTASESEAISMTIILLAHQLGMSVVAECVENEAQQAFLKRYNCDSVQGYLYSPPKRAEEIVEFLRQHRPE